MPRTFFQSFNRDDGSPVTVEYSFASGSPTTYSPLNGACGGDPCEVAIVSCWPNTPEYNALVCDRNALAEHYLPQLLTRGVVVPKDKRIARLDERLEAMEAACKLTDAEDERMCAWLAEHHVDEPDDEPYF
jgi:hypothetical protein